MADFTDESQLGGPLPIPPPPGPMMGGSAATPIEQPSGTMTVPSPNVARSGQLQQTLQNPLYRFGSALAGSNPAAEELRGIQGQDLAQQHYQLQLKQFQQQQEQFLTTKKMAIGGMIIQGLEATAKMPSDQRPAFMQTFGPLVMGLSKEVGYAIPPNVFQSMATTPGLATKFASTIQAKFGGDQTKANEIAAQLADVPVKDVPTYIESLYKSEVESAVPQVQKYISDLTAKIKSDPALMSRLGLLDEKGKPKPIPGSMIEQAAAGYPHFQTNVHQAAVQQVLGDNKYAGFLANRGIQSGEADVAAQKTLGETLAKESTPGGQATVAETQAKVGLTTSQTAESKAKTAETQQSTALGKVLPVQQGGGVATVKPGADGQPIVNMVQSPGAKIQDVSTIRKDFETQAKNFVTVRDYYNRLTETASNPSPAGDLAMIFSYMKILDPTSVVREGEQATAQNATGVTDRVRNLYNRVLTGEKLNPNQRADFVKQSGRIMDSASDSHKKLEDNYRGIAERSGVNPADVVVDFMGNLRNRQKSTAKTPDQRALDKFNR